MIASFRWLAVTLLLASCGSSAVAVNPPPAPPPPPPPVTVASVVVTPGSATTTVGSTTTLSAATLDASGNTLSGHTITWNSSNPAIATVATGVVTGVAAGGPVTITATSESKSGTAQVTVGVAPGVGSAGGTVGTSDGLATVTIPAGALTSNIVITVAANPAPPASAQLIAGTAYDFGPTGTTFAQPVTLRLSYAVSAIPAGSTASDLRVARWSGTGWVPITVGTVDAVNHTVAGSTSSFSTYAIITAHVAVSTVSIAPLAPNATLGGTVQLTATTKDAQGNALTDRSVTWSSLTPTIATVSATGLVSALAVGTATIKATSETVAGQVSVTVIAPAGVASARTMSTGADHACAIGVDGTLYCWGANDDGQLGDGTTTARNTPTRVMSAASFVAVTAGQQATCAIATDGALYCWGLNDHGQLGVGTTSNSTVPLRVGPAQWTAVSAGYWSACGVSNGQTSCWGSNTGRALGTGSGDYTLNLTVPTHILNDPGLSTVTAGGYTACGLKSDGTAWCWGSATGNGVDPSPLPSMVNTTLRFAQLSSNGSQVCGVTSDHKLYCWGANSFGELGNGTTSSSGTPTAVAGTNAWASVGVGQFHVCAVDLSGATWCWGDNRSYALGSNGASTTLPTRVSGASVVSVHGGGGFTCGVTAGGGAQCWGGNHSGVLGNGEYDFNPLPQAVAGGHSVAHISTDEAGACLVTTTSELWCWSGLDVPTPVRTFASLLVSQVSAGTTNLCLITATTAVTECWGSNAEGQSTGTPGAGSTTPVTAPIATGASAIAVGFEGACGLVSTSIYCWGLAAGEAGPVQVGPGIEWTKVTSMWQTSCGITSSAAGYCWTNNVTPVAITSPSVWSVLAPGSLYTCGISSGQTYCWGSNRFGQLGDGSTTDHALPALASGSHAFTQLVSGSDFTCGLEATNAWCWGRNRQGELGDGTLANRSTPVQVSGGHHFTSITAGSDESVCGIDTAGAAWCWGSNEENVLGSGELAAIVNPATVLGGITFRALDVAQLRRP